MFTLGMRCFDEKLNPLYLGPGGEALKAPSTVKSFLPADELVILRPVHIFKRMERFFM